jgi:hypothetical protein
MSSAVAERIAELGPKQRALLELRLGLREGDGSTADRRLVAYVVPKKGEGPSVAELRRFAERELPAYMVPSVFVILDSAPLTAGGKLDRAALPAPQNTRPELDEAYVAPQTAMERNISAAWQEVLGIDKVGLHDNFFDLGGHSLLMVRLQSRLNTVLGTHVAIIDLFRYPTVSSLARYLSRAAAPRKAFEPVQQRADKQRELLGRRPQQKA